MAKTARERIGAWFFWGVGGQVLGGLLAAVGVLISPNPDNWTSITGFVLIATGWSATMVGIIGKGVELGVRAANDE